MNDKSIMPCIVFKHPTSHLEFFEFSLPKNEKVILSAHAVDGWLQAHPNMTLHAMMLILCEHNRRMNPLQLERGIAKKGN